MIAIKFSSSKDIDKECTKHSKSNNKCFQYAVTVALNHEEINKIPTKNIKN